jgi:hypothetical protein
MRNVICTSKAPGVGPYSQAVRGGGFIFVSGQLALDPVTRQIIEGDARQQTERALQNIVRDDWVLSWISLSKRRALGTSSGWITADCHGRGRTRARQEH